MVSNIFYRLSDRNTRNGIQIFEDFCKSGHIQSEDILLIRTSGSDYQLPSYKFMNALLRKNRRYYNGEQSNFVNLFYSDYRDDFPDPFIRVDILLWLERHSDQVGPSKYKGMFPVKDLLRELQMAGHDELVAQRELVSLIKKGLILSENQTAAISLEDLVKITLSGRLHLGLLNNVTYLAACAENTLFKNTAVMTRISRRISSSNYLSKLSVILTANDLIRYLSSYREEYCAKPNSYVEDGKYPTIYDLRDCRNAIEKSIDEDSYIKDLLNSIAIYSPGTQVQAKVMKKEDNCVVCFFADDRKGFLSTFDEKYHFDGSEYKSVQIGNEIICEIMEFDYEHKSFQLKYLSK